MKRQRTRITNYFEKEERGISLPNFKTLYGYSDQELCGRVFPGDAVVKNPPANAGDTGSSPGPGRSHTPRSS